MPTFNFTTGPATLPDVGELSYNGCVFSPLFASKVSGVFVKDDAGRTTKLIEYTITAEGYVTLRDGQADVGGTLFVLESLLSKPGGALRYNGRGLNLSVNTAGGTQDVAWGPIPEVLDITPLGAGRSAQVMWTVKVRVPPKLARGVSIAQGPVLQFCYDTVVSYDEAGYSRLSISGVTEIPLTRAAVATRTLTQTADDYRSIFPGRLLDTIDLRQFRITRRDFKVSKDKRTLEFNVEAEEHSWMELPPAISLARGQYMFKPARAGMGLASWLCTLSCTYTVPKGKPRRLAWFAFLALLRVRMNAGNIHGTIPATSGNSNIAATLATTTVLATTAVGEAVFPGNIPGPLANNAAINFWLNVTQANRPLLPPSRKVFLVDFSGNEGLYADAKTVTFSATWRLVTNFSTILLASGLWKKVPDQTSTNWSTSMRNISGSQSWLQNRLDPNAQAIVDFGV